MRGFDNTSRFAIALGGLAIVGLMAVIAYRPSDDVADARNVPEPRSGSLIIADPNRPCGAVCVAIVCRYFGRAVPVDEIAAAMPPDPRGRNSLAEIQRVLEQQGLAAVGVEVPRNGCPPVDVPMIAHVYESHFAVLLPGSDGSAVLLDPPHPPVAVDPHELARIWNGVALIVGTDQTDIARNMQLLASAAGRTID